MTARHSQQPHHQQVGPLVDSPVSADGRCQGSYLGSGVIAKGSDSELSMRRGSGELHNDHGGLGKSLEESRTRGVGERGLQLRLGGVAEGGPGGEQRRRDRGASHMMVPVRGISRVVALGS